MLVTLIAFIVVIGVLIFVHELGHFMAAKAVGIGVPRFSIGFGPATPLAFTLGETEYVVSWLPVGGYVKMASREEQEAMGAVEGGDTPEDYPPEKLFENKPLWARVIVLSAGVAMNALFAWVVYIALALAVGRSESPITTVAFVDSTVLPGSARALGRVSPGARIVAINRDTVDTWDDVTSAVIDPRSDGLRFDFADAEPVVVPVPGTDMRGRAAIADALKPAWPAAISAVEVGMAAHRAGLEPGDRIVRLGADTVRYWADLQRLLAGREGDSLTVAVARGDSVIETVMVPELRSDRDLVTGRSVDIAKIGVYPQLEFVQVRFSVAGAIADGTRRTVNNFNTVLFTLKAMIVRDVSVRELAGPIFIGQASGRLAQAGLVPLLVFMAFLSVNLAILNLLPIPVLDGGHLVFLALEGIRGKPVSLKWRIRFTQLGVFVILGLTVLVFANDILRIIGG